MIDNYDVIIVGAGFAGLAMARVLCREGLSVLVMERKKTAGQGMHTTGILVKEALPLLTPPAELTREISRVLLHSPKGQTMALQKSDYFFLATDTPALMQWMSDVAQSEGVKIAMATPYQGAEITANGIKLHGYPITGRFLIGADGARSRVARDFSLGTNQRFLLGVEAEYRHYDIAPNDGFHCFFGQKFAAGYLGWAVPAPGYSQIGLACIEPHKPNIHHFSQMVAKRLHITLPPVTERRGGLIPVGGLVKKLGNERVLLVGDAAGMVSPLSAGGIHTALHYGELMGDILAKWLRNKGSHPVAVAQKSYPHFHTKQVMRRLYEYWPDCLTEMGFNVANTGFNILAKRIFLHPKKL
ncbi:MAG: NAD(P)/FAD-dependent oxidoreductase [Alphaproteobacteria bacterium]